jgi:membrane AbrB-like protein
MQQAMQIVVTLAIGLAGALAVTAASLPAAALIGSTLAVTAVSLCRLPTRIPPWLRNMAFAVIGCSLGSGVNGEFLDLAGKWSASLAGLVLAMAVILLAGSWLLVAFFGQSRETAILAASPGALSYSLAIAAGGIGDARSILIIQSIRLLAITTCLPPLLGMVDPQQTGVGAAVRDSIPFIATAGLFLATLVIGFLFNTRRLPAAFLIAGVLVSGLSHYLGLVSGRPQSEFLFVGFVITGSVIGARFTRIPMADLRRLIGAAFSGVCVSSVLAALLAWLAATVLGLPFGQLWVAYAPGGVEAMAAMALSLGYDSTFVATHHLFRIVLLIFILPLLLKMLRMKTIGIAGESGKN